MANPGTIVHVTSKIPDVTSSVQPVQLIPHSLQKGTISPASHHRDASLRNQANCSDNIMVMVMVMMMMTTTMMITTIIVVVITDIAMFRAAKGATLTMSFALRTWSSERQFHHAPQQPHKLVCKAFACNL